MLLHHSYIFSQEDRFYGVVNSEGNRWQEQRRFALKTLRDLGFGRTKMEEIIKEELMDVCQGLEAANGKFINMDRRFNTPVERTIFRVISNEPLNPNDPRLVTYHKNSELVFRHANKPWISFIGFVPGGEQLIRFMGLPTLTDFFNGHLDIIDEVIQKHKETYQEDDIRDFTDAYLQKMDEAAKDTYSSFSGREGNLNLRNVLADLLRAGTDSTSVTISWSFLYMTNYPDVQKKVQDELDSVIGRGRLPEWSDRGNLPYTQATLLEVQRRANIVPNGVPRRARKDCHLGGFFIPADTIVFAELGSVMLSPKLFPEPKKFKPERFLVDGKFQASPYVIPFGSGKRRCIGETMSIVELFRFFTGILHQFHVEKRPEAVNPDAPGSGVLAMPDSFDLRFIPRN